MNRRLATLVALELLLLGVALLTSRGNAASPGPANTGFDVLPAGKDRELVLRSCAVCHPIELVVARRRTDADWEKQMSRMMDFGAKATDDEQDRILDYLEGWFSSERQPP